MAVGNLPNELPRDASRYFGEQILKEVFDGMIKGNSAEIERATIVKNGQLTPRYEYMSEYAGLLPAQ
jgi:saccharopine dehydrogenase (NAD+, L-lysine forming)